MFRKQHIILTRLILLAIIAMTTWSCSSVKRPETVAPCIKENQKQLMIRWGTTSEAGTTEIYELDAKGEVWVVSIEGVDTTRKHRAVIDPTLYCTTASDVNTTFLKIQALFSPGTRARYIEYTNAPSSVYLRAVWNPDLATFQSRDMRALYEDLMKLVPQD